MRNTHALASTT